MEYVAKLAKVSLEICVYAKVFASGMGEFLVAIKPLCARIKENDYVVQYRLQIFNVASPVEEKQNYFIFVSYIEKKLNLKLEYLINTSHNDSSFSQDGSTMFRTWDPTYIARIFFDTNL